MMTFIRVTAYENICKKDEIVTSQVVVQVDFLLVSSEALAIIFVFIDHVKSDNITITTNYLSPDPTCPIHNLSLIWLDTGWTQWLGLWLNGFCLCISMMDSLWTWRTVASDPDGMSLQSDDVCPAHALGVRPCESGGVSCLWLSLNTDINIQRSASCEPRVTRREIESLWPGPGSRHQTPAPEAAGGNCVSVWTMTMLCQMTQGCVTDPDLSFYLNRYLISAMTRGDSDFINNLLLL